jgi:uncharacterized protein (TIGR00645 family)
MHFHEVAAMTEPNRGLEALLERLLVLSRWLLAPFFLGLALGVVILLIKFAQEFYHMAAQAITISDEEAILGMLTLIDLALMGALVMIVIFSGYENFVSKIDHTSDRRWPEWMGSIDFTSLKIKLLGSIVAISAIQLLKQFMAVKSASDRELWWYAGIHIVFVVSSVLLALSDRLSASHVQPEGKEKAPPADGAGGTH